MGALHIGHLSLIDRARVENTCVVVSIFVNPLQFGKGEDFEKYPRTLESDRQICETAGVEAIFAPSAEEIGVNDPHVTQVIPPPEMMNIMCGRSRIGHFQGVATIVTKLLNIVQPDRAYFGEKDGQQLAIIRRLVNDLNLPVEIVGCPTLRELSGLAYSSRNQYLSESDRLLAPHLYQSLLKGKQIFSQNSSKISPSAIPAASRDYLSKLPAIALEYIELVDVKTMQPCHTITSSSELMLAIAARIGNTRLIDNILLSQTITPRKPIIAIDGPA